MGIMLFQVLCSHLFWPLGISPPCIYVCIYCIQYEYIHAYREGIYIIFILYVVYIINNTICMYMYIYTTFNNKDGVFDTPLPLNMDPKWMY